MSSRTGFALAIGLLLLAAGLRVWNLTTLPPGLHSDEITDIRITETVRAGNISVFYNLEPLGQTGGREGLYHTLVAAITTLTGSGLVGYRLLSVFANVLALALVYALVARLYGTLAGVAALALLALGMWPILLARTVGRETLLPLLAAAVLLALTRALPVHRDAPPRTPGTTLFAALGLLLGLGFYIHPSSFSITLGSMTFIAYMLISRQPLSRRTLSYIGFSILVMIIVAMPYVLSSIRLPQLDGAGRIFEGYTLAANPPLQSIIDNVIGIFFAGDSDPTHNLPGRPMFDLVSGLIMLVGFIVVLRNWRRPRFTLPLITLLALTPVIFFSANSPDFGHFAAALPVLALFFGLGVTTFYNSLVARSRIVLAVGLVALLVFNLVWTVNDLFNHWPATSYQTYNGRIGQLAAHIDQTADELPTVVCTPTVRAFASRPQLTDAQLLILMMHSRGRFIRYADCGSGLVLANGGEREQIILPRANMRVDIHPYLLQWLEMGQNLTGDHLPPDSVVMLDVAEELADTIGGFTSTAPVRYAPEAPGEPEITLPPVTFGGNLTFLGYELSSTSDYQPGDIITSTTYWRVDGPPPRDVRLFTHITSDPAAVMAQNDTISVLASQLRPRDIFIQITFVPLPDSTPDGRYEISIGAYQESDDMRLPVMDGTQARGTRLFLANNGFTVTQGE